MKIKVLKLFDKFWEIKLNESEDGLECRLIIDFPKYIDESIEADELVGIFEETGLDVKGEKNEKNT